MRAHTRSSRFHLLFTPHHKKASDVNLSNLRSRMAMVRTMKDGDGEDDENSDDGGGEGDVMSGERSGGGPQCVRKFIWR